jgi:hypothetical protein
MLTALEGTLWPFVVLCFSLGPTRTVPSICSTSVRGILFGRKGEPGYVYVCVVFGVF